MRDRLLHKIIEEPGVHYQEQDSELAVIRLSRTGIKKKGLHTLADTLGLTMQETARLLPITERTLQRRTPDSRLNKAVSQQIILLAQLFEQATTLLGSTENARAWLREPNTSLGGGTPLELLDTAMGIQLVAERLGRLQYGVYS